MVSGFVSFPGSLWLCLAWGFFWRGWGGVGRVGQRLGEERGTVSRGHLREGPITWRADLPKRSSRQALGVGEGWREPHSLSSLVCGQKPKCK